MGGINDFDNNLTEDDLKTKSYSLTVFQKNEKITLYSRNDRYEIYKYGSTNYYQALTTEELLQLKKRIAVFNNGIERNLMTY